MLAACNCVSPHDYPINHDDGRAMTYPEALEALRGNQRYWFFDLYGRTDEKARQEAIELAQTWKRPEYPDISEHLAEASQQSAIAVKPCGSC